MIDTPISFHYAPRRERINFTPLFNAVVIQPIPEAFTTPLLPKRSSLVLPGSAMHAGRFDEKGGTDGRYLDRGVVIAVGTGYKYGRRFVPDYTAAKTGKWEEVTHAEPLPLEVKPGDVVLYGHKGGQDAMIDGNWFDIVNNCWVQCERLCRIISERQIEAILEP